MRADRAWIALAACAIGCRAWCPSVPFGGHPYWIAPSSRAGLRAVTAAWVRAHTSGRSGPLDAAACAAACEGAGARCELVEVAPAAVQRETLRRVTCRYQGPDGAAAEFWRLFDPSEQGMPASPAGCAAACDAATWTTPVQCEVGEPVVTADAAYAVLCRREVAGRCYSPGSAQ